MSPLNYNPKDASSCWPAGDYHASLAEVEDKRSKKTGADMQVLTWTVYHDDGRTQSVDDYIVVPTGLWKLRQFAVALALRDEFDAGRFQADDHVGADVIVSLVIEANPGYDDKNKIKSLKSAAEPAPKASTPESKAAMDAQLADDDVPF